MENTMEKKLDIMDESFSKLVGDIDQTMQKLLKNMIEKGSYVGKITIGIDVELKEEFVPDMNSETEMRRVLNPMFSHKVGSVMQIKTENKGDIVNAGMELVYDEEKGEYVLRPVANVDQTSIFDDEYKDVPSDVKALPAVDDDYGYEDPEWEEE